MADSGHMTFHRLLLFTTMLALTPAALASVGAPENRAHCINGNVANNKSLLASFDTNKDPLRLAFLKTQEVAKSSQPPKVYANNYPVIMTDIENCFQTDASLKQMGYLKHIANHMSGVDPNYESTVPNEAQKAFSEVAKQSAPEKLAPKIKRECIRASMTRQPGNDGYTCSYPKGGGAKSSQSVLKSYGTAGGDSLQCVNDRMVDYMTYAVNSAIACMSPNDPIDSRVIYKKINNETGFNPSISYSGGVGLGQITSSAKNEMTDAVLGRGRYILEGITESKKPECEGFKNVAAADLKKSPRVGNSCEWLNPGDGLARNLMHTVGYYLAMRDQYIIPALEKRSAHLLTNPSLISDFTAIAYGGEGLEKAKLLMQKYRAGKSTNIKDLQKKIRRDSKYLSNIEGKIRETNCIRNNVDPNSKECKEGKLSEADLEADSCITK